MERTASEKVYKVGLEGREQRILCSRSKSRYIQNLVLKDENIGISNINNIDIALTRFYKSKYIYEFYGVCSLPNKALKLTALQSRFYYSRC